MKKIQSSKRPSGKLEDSSGNVFIDLGFDPEEAEELTTKAELLNKITKTIERRDLRQSQIAKILGVDQPRVSKLLSGHLENYSVDTLMQFLAKLGNVVTIQEKPTPGGIPGYIQVGPTQRAERKFKAQHA